MLKHFKSSPLWLIGLFIIFAQGTAGVAAVQIEGWPQEALVIFVISYSSIVTVIFFAFLWFKPENFYGPAEYGEISPSLYRDALRGLPSETAEAVEDYERNPGDKDALFRLIDNLLREESKQHLLLMRKEGGFLDVSNLDERGHSHGYEIITRNKGVSMGVFSPRQFLQSLSGTELVTVSGGGSKIFLSERGEGFADWMIKNERDAETFNSDIGGWGKKQTAADVLNKVFEATQNVEKDVTPERDA